VPSRRNPAPAQSTGTADNKGAGLRSRAHATGAGLKPADSTRWVFLLLLSGAVSCCCCCCLSRRCCSWSARAAENLAAHRCSHLLSRSRGILLIAKAPGPRSPLGLKAHNARGPLKVHPVEEQSIGSRLVNRATLAALVRGPARYPSHPCLNPKAGPCSDNRAPHAAAGIDQHHAARDWGAPVPAPAGFTSVGANRLEASVQGPWTSSGLHTRQAS